MNLNLSLGRPWTVSKIYGSYRRLYPHEVAAQWGEATWTARDLWQPNA